MIDLMSEGESEKLHAAQPKQGVPPSRNTRQAGRGRQKQQESVAAVGGAAGHTLGGGGSVVDMCDSPSLASLPARKRARLFESPSL